MYYQEVGKLYREGITRYDECARFDFSQSGAVLELFFNKPTKKEIEDIAKGKFEIGFYEYERENIIFMLFRFGNGQWMDAPYTVHLSQPFEFMDLEPGMGYSLSVYLIDAATGILKAIRYVGLSTDFSYKFREAVEKQKQVSFKPEAYNREINYVYTNYSTLDLVKRADAWCKIRERRD